MTAFSLIELLVVIAVILVLAGLTLPVLAKARNEARRVADMNNMGQIGKAIVNYSSLCERLPDARCVWPAVGYLWPGKSTVVDPGESPADTRDSLYHLLGPYLGDPAVWINPNAVCGLTADGTRTTEKREMVQSYVPYSRNYSLHAYGRSSSYLHSRFDNLDGGPVARRADKKFWLRNSWLVKAAPNTTQFESAHERYSRKPGVNLLYNDGHVIYSEGHRTTVSTPW